MILHANRMWALYLAGRWRDAERAELQFLNQVRQPGGMVHEGWLLVLLGQGRLNEASVIVANLLAETANGDDVRFRAFTLMLAGELADLDRADGMTRANCSIRDLP